MAAIDKKKSISILFLLFCIFILALSVRGLPGNPTSAELNSLKWQNTGPFESSNERGRFALTYSFIEDKTMYFSEDLARFSAPDLAITKAGRYVSLFAPATAFLTIPGYIAGKYLGAAQLGVFAVIALFAFLNIILIRSIAMRLGADNIASIIGALAFAFATPAFTYGVTLSQHHISTFIILLGIYTLLRWNNYRSPALIWFLTAFSVTVDNPNIFFMLPIALGALGKIVIFQSEENGFNIKVKLLGFLSFLIVIFPIGFFLWFNAASNGSPFQISGTLERVVSVDEKNKTVQTLAEEELAQKNKIAPEKSKNAVGFFNTRNLANGFYIHFLSPDRGLINYAPVILAGVFGLFFLYKQNALYANILTAISGFNILLYSMWGDPYGGWAFGSRYLIPVYAMLAIGAGIVLTRWRKNIVFLIIFFMFFNYSAKVNTLGALTSNANPPQVEILALEKITGKAESYTYERNEQYLKEKGSKSFVFQAYLRDKITAQNYYYSVYILIIAGALFFLSLLKFKEFDFGKIFALIKTIRRK